MNKVLIILNYQREIPPFIQTEIKFAKQKFSKIIYITPPLYNDNSDTIKDKNVEILTIPGYVRFWAYLKLPVLYLRPEVIKQVYDAFLAKIFCFDYIKKLSIELFSAEQLRITAKRFLHKELCDSSFVLASWFSGVAYAAAKLQQEKVVLKSVSLAHSYEINPERCIYNLYFLNDFKHKYLSNVCFIAQEMYNIYFKAQKHQFLNDRSFVSYLGCQRLFPIMDIDTKVNTHLHICSCSSMTKVKRLSLLLECFRLWKGADILWTHIGDGPEREVLTSVANEVMKENSRIKISFKGKMSNEEVQKFYSTNAVDLFVNVSSSEGLPVSIMEALSYGIPCLATNVGGTHEIVDDSVGFLIDKEETPFQIVEIIREYTMLSKERKHQMRINALQRWEKYFDAEKNINLFLNEFLSEKK